jgi:acetyl esterase
MMAVPIARAGYLVFNINYRQGPGHPYPAPLADACRALLWVHENCARYGGDPSRIAVAGESAGGNLVTALAVAASWRRTEPFTHELFAAAVRLRAVMATYGFLDLGHTREYLTNPRTPRWAKALLLDAARSYVGHDVDGGALAFPLASPLRVIEERAADPLGPDRPLPPFFAAAGTRDPLLRCSKRLKAALDALGTPCELHISPGEIHGFDAMVWRTAAREKWRAARAFLDHHMKGPAPREADAAEAPSVIAAGAFRAV